MQSLQQYSKSEAATIYCADISINLQKLFIVIMFLGYATYQLQSLFNVSYECFVFQRDNHLCWFRS